MKTIKFSREDLIKCYNFSKAIISDSNQYNRFSKNNTIQIERTFAGKLGEYAFLLYLRNIGINYPEGDMFKIFQGQTNVDQFDFQTPNGKLIDIKVASKPFHSRIMIPIDQFQLRKDFYVGIKLDFQINEKSNLIINSVKKAKIHGFCFRDELENKTTQNFGEGACKSIDLKSLREIEKLSCMF